MSSYLLNRRLFQVAVAAGLAMSTTLAPAQTNPVAGGVLNAIINPEPPSLNLALQQVQSTQIVASKIYESLLIYTQKLQPTPGLARAWTMSDDRLTYTFQLQRGVRWHDGKPFSSADVVFTYKKILANTARAKALMENVSDVIATDPDTVVFKLKQPYSAFLYAFDIGGGAILPKHLYDVPTELGRNPYNNAPIGTGPFKFSKWERGSHIELVRNSDYWRQGLPYLDGITYRVIPDSASRRVALEQDTVQQAVASDLEPIDGPRLRKLPTLTVSTAGSEYWAPLQWIEMNNSIAPFNDKRFRQAVMHAIDREFVVNKIFFGLGTVATGPINHMTRFYDPNVKQYPYDPKLAAKLLDEMGLVADSNGVRVRTTFIPMPYGEAYRRFGEYLKLSLGKVGIAVTIENVDVGTWVKRMGDGDYQMVANGVFQYGDPAIGVARTYLSTNIRKGVAFTNTSQYRNPKVDELFLKAATVPDQERQALYSEIQRILVEDVPVAWIVDAQQPVYLSKRVQNANITALGAAGSYAEAWLLKK